jgi:hypothetical protein
VSDEQVTDETTVEVTETTQPEVTVTGSEPVVTDTEATAPANAFEDRMNVIKASGTAAQISLITALEKYLKMMRPGVPVERNVGARNQYDLWKSILFITEDAPAEDFKKTWNILLAYFEEYKEQCFHDRYIYRFAEFWIWSESELAGFQRIVNLIKLTCNISERNKNLKLVVLDKTLELGFTDNARQRVISFYS